MTNNYEYTSLYYETPVQVKFYTTDNEIRGGIAYHDFIICGCCGLIFPIQEIVDDAKKDGIHFDDAIVEMEWVDIEDGILGE